MQKLLFNSLSIDFERKQKKPKPTAFKDAFLAKTAQNWSSDEKFVEKGQIGRRIFFFRHK